MSTTATLSSLDITIAELTARIDALRSTLGKSDPTRPMNPTAPARKHSRAVATSRAYRITCTASTTTRSLHRHQLTRTIEGLNELDARVTLGKKLRKEGLYLQHVLDIREVRG